MQEFGHSFQTVILMCFNVQNDAVPTLLLRPKPQRMVYSCLFSYTSWSVNGRQMICHPSCVQEKVLKTKRSATTFIPISGNFLGTQLFSFKLETLSLNAEAQFSSQCLCSSVESRLIDLKVTVGILT